MIQTHPSKELVNPKITFKQGDDQLRSELLRESDPITVELDDAFSEYVRKSAGTTGYNAYFFLVEPLYRLSSSYIPSHWILSVLTDFGDLNPYTNLLKLEYNNCDAVLTNEGVLIYKCLNG